MKKSKNGNYQPKPEHKFSFGLWTVGNRGRDFEQFLFLGTAEMCNAESCSIERVPESRPGLLDLNAAQLTP